MVLGLIVPPVADFNVPPPPWPVFMSDVIIFVDVGVYWNKRRYGYHPSIWCITEYQC